MAGNPFHDELDDTFRGTRVRAHTTEHTYEGWARLWHYNQPAIVLYDATRNDGEQLGAVTIDNPEIVERLGSQGVIEEVSVATISDSPLRESIIDQRPTLVLARGAVRSRIGYSKTIVPHQLAIANSTPGGSYSSGAAASASPSLARASRTPAGRSIASLPLVAHRDQGRPAALTARSGFAPSPRLPLVLRSRQDG
jgi:hypothetical protein